MRFLCGSLVFAALAACGSTSAVTSSPSANGDPTADESGDTQKLTDAGRDAKSDASPVKGTTVRIMTGNISSGNDSTYDHTQTTDLIAGLHPDIALLQEMKVGDNTDDAFQSFVQTTFGADYVGYREAGFKIPNAIVSRYPIADSGEWTDDRVSDRSFVWAKITVPGAHPLWAVSVHLLTTSATNRDAEAGAIVSHLQEVAGADDYLVLGGDFNTDVRTEAVVTTLATLFVTAAPYPADQNGNDRTNINRNKPYDWVVVDPKLATRQVPTVLGKSSYPSGLVFDSRVYTPLDEVAPVQADDSGFTNMQHMPVVKDFAF